MDNTLKNRILFWFRVANFSCEHKVWIYAGSFYKYTNFKNQSFSPGVNIVHVTCQENGGGGGTHREREVRELSQHGSSL